MPVTTVYLLCGLDCESGWLLPISCFLWSIAHVPWIKIHILPPFDLWPSAGHHPGVPKLPGPNCGRPVQSQTQCHRWASAAGESLGFPWDPGVLLVVMTHLLSRFPSPLFPLLLFLSLYKYIFYFVALSLSLPPTSLFLLSVSPLFFLSLALIHLSLSSSLTSSLSLPQPFALSLCTLPPSSLHSGEERLWQE